MKRTITFLLVLAAFTSCEEALKDQDKKEGFAKDSVVTKDKESLELSIEQRTEQLKEKGYQVFHYKEGDTTYLMQQYFMVFLKAGKKRNQDSLETAKLQEKHLIHLERMAKEGYISLTRPFGDDGNLRGIVVYNTPNLKMADSLANLDPMVKAGRLEVEILPWWTAKGGTLK